MNSCSSTACSAAIATAWALTQELHCKHGRPTRRFVSQHCAFQLSSLKIIIRTRLLAPIRYSVCFFLFFHIFVDFRISFPPPWARMLHLGLFGVPFLIDFGAVFGRERGKPHNVLGFIPESISRTFRFWKKSKPHNVPGYVLENISRPFFSMNRGRQRKEKYDKRKRKERNKRKTKEQNIKES